MTPTPQSRRSRPAKKPLSREWIIAATIDIVRTEGLAKATMRRVAQALDTGPASLYVYVANTTELHVAVLDYLTGSLPEALGDGPWQYRLEQLLGAYSEVLFEYPGLARSALVLRPMGPNTIRLVDRVLELLLEGGIPVSRAAWGVDLLLQQVIATAAEHSPTAPAESSLRNEQPESSVDVGEALRGADPANTPLVAAHAEVLLAGTTEERQTWAVRALLAGIAATSTPVSV